MSFLQRILGSHHGRGHGGSRGGHHGGRQGAEAPPPGASNCSNCRGPNAREARFCQRCGTSLAPGNCVQCAAPLAAGARFCGQCGSAAG